MKLFERQSKELLADHGIQTPSGDAERYVVKAQVLAKNRATDGGVRFADSEAEAERLAEEMRGSEVNGHRVDDVLVEPAVEHDTEYYVSVIYDTDARAPAMLFSTEGGSGVEDRSVARLALDSGGEQWRFREFLADNGVSSAELTGLGRTLAQLYDCFRGEDARLLEVNPLARTEDGYVALDATVELDDDADYRRGREIEGGTEFGRPPTERERRAAEIDRNDHRGVAGKYTELDGTIAMMLAGGGASLTNMDSLIEYGGEPANYTEYGGNPPTEKVYELTKVILSKDDLRGLWHVGGTANNTDVLRTMKGFCQALREIEPTYPIVVRRDGPHADEAFDLLRETRDDLGLEMKLFRNDTPMSETAGELMEMVE